MLSFSVLQNIAIPGTGWIKAIRTSLGMSMLQLGNRLAISKQAVLDMEKREMQGSITIRSLKEIANALDMQLVYGFVPNDGSLDALIERRANQLAKNIIMRTHNSMVLEDQGNSDERLAKAIHERTELLMKEMPKILWD